MQNPQRVVFKHFNVLFEALICKTPCFTATDLSIQKNVTTFPIKLQH